jgi:hypothetical protein
MMIVFVINVIDRLSTSEMNRLGACMVCSVCGRVQVIARFVRHSFVFGIDDHCVVRLCVWVCDCLRWSLKQLKQVRSQLVQPPRITFFRSLCVDAKLVAHSAYS